MKVDKLLPEVYYKESRDFAYVGRLLEILFNYMKTAADCVSINIDNEGIEGNLIDLLVDTLGFELKHEYVNKDLISIGSAFSSLLKLKGTTDAVEMAVRLLLNSQGIKNTSDFNFCVLDVEKAEMMINIPDTLSDIVLLEDLFDYILPVGITYSFTRFGNVNNKKETDVIANTSLTRISKYDDSDKIASRSTYVFDSDIGIVKSDSIPGMQIDDIYNIGGLHTGVVVTEIQGAEETASSLETSESDAISDDQGIK